MRRIFLAYFTILFSVTLLAQNNRGTISGTILDVNGNPQLGIAVGLKGTFIGTATDFNGHYEITGIIPNNYTILVSGLGFKDQTHDIKPTGNKKVKLDIQLEEESLNISELKVTSKSKASTIEQSGFSVNVIEIKELKAQSIELNTILKLSAGVGVRESGGLGSSVNYSLSGMNGNSVVTLIDNIPTDFYGSSYSIGMLPISLVDRIDIYNGVVPVVLGTDALGGAINVITTTKNTNFLDASYSIGSFNTHRASLQGQWILPKSGFTTRFSTFYNYSDNSYKVWGKSVYRADASTGWRPIEYTRDNPATRFNDDITNFGGKIDFGFSNTKWTDKFFVTLAASNIEKGVQTGQSMAKVFGGVRYKSEYIMSSMMYHKNDLLVDGLDVDAFIGYSEIEGTFVDTSGVQYNWTGDSIGYVFNGGELSSSYKSIYTETRKNWFGRYKTSYEIGENTKFTVCYVNRSTNQEGYDPYAAEYRQRYTQPQSVMTRFLGVSMYNVSLDGRLRSNAFVKYYGLKAIVNDLETYEDNEQVIIAIESLYNKWGGGYAGSFNINDKTILQLSLEQAIRLPSVEEALGNGTTILNNPYLKPEESFNVNLDLILGPYEIGYNQNLKLEFNTFYRNTKNLLQLAEVGGLGTAQFENINEVLTKGFALGVKYDINHKLKILVNTTYLDMRNNQKYDYETGKDNIIYKDRLKNEPYLMANASVRYSFYDFFQKNSKMNVYASGSYIHKFYLLWPSLGDPNTKDIVPTQLVFNTGISYRLPSKKISLALDCSNLFNEQLYDNYLLQKPGRAFYFKITYHLN